MHRATEPLPLWLRVVLFVLGWILVLVGVAGLVLPGLQGILTIFAGIATLSLASEAALKVLRSLLSRSPRTWRRVVTWRRKLHRRLSNLGGEEDGEESSES